MNTRTEGNNLLVNGKRQKAVVSVSQTNSGYTISRGGSARMRANMGELVAITGCLFFGAASFAQWLIPESRLGADIFAYQVSGTIMFFVFSALLYLIARRGLFVEAQVDTKRGIFRIVRRNREGVSTPLTELKFAEIGSVFIKRSKSDLIGNQMFLRLKSGSSIQIINGPVKELEPLLDRIQNDFRGQMPTAPKQVRAAVQTTERPRARSAFAAG
jgi:hypothetical protein